MSTTTLEYDIEALERIGQDLIDQYAIEGVPFDLSEVAAKAMTTGAPTVDALWTLAQEGLQGRLRSYVSGLRPDGETESPVVRSGRNITTRRRPYAQLQYVALSLPYANRHGQLVALLEFEADDFDALATAERSKAAGHAALAALAERSAAEMRKAKVAHLRELSARKLTDLDRVWKARGE